MSAQPKYPGRMDPEQNVDEEDELCAIFGTKKCVPYVRGAGILFLLISYILLLFFNGFGGTGDLGIFQHKVGNLSEASETWVTPEPWVLYIWVIIFIWLGFAIGYEFALLFRKDSLINRLYLTAPVVYPLFNFLLTLDFAMVIVWMFEYDDQNWSSSSVIIVIIAFVTMITVGVGAVRVEKKKHDISDKDLWMSRLCVLNGVAVFATWIFLSALLNCCQAFKFDGETKDETVALFYLAFLFVGIIGYFLLETTVLEQYMRYIGTPYIVLLWTLAAILPKLQRESSDDGLTPDLCLALLALVALLFLIKFILAVVRHKRQKKHQVNT